ncbi:hypothetical protein CPC08DRAFT_712721 [Agrocybe pediades]|nr:hypothetical protein CPC08DRAFT_712721 [Agrocybe pediades]
MTSSQSTISYALQHRITLYAQLPIISQDQPVRVKRTGTADIIAFGRGGTYILRNSVRREIRKVSPVFSYNEGWRNTLHVRVVGDTRGNNLSDIIGFGSDGVYISHNNGDNTFGTADRSAAGFDSDEGWNNANHIRCVADLRKKGYVDLLGFGDQGVYVSKNNGDGSFAPAEVVLTDFGYGSKAGQWRIERHLRFIADTTGNGLPDIVGFGEENVFSATNKGDGTFNPAQKLNVGNAFTVSNGWEVGLHPRMLAHVSGDKRVDIIGFGPDGVYVSYNNGDGTYRPAKRVLEENDFSPAKGWKGSQHPRFVVDITGDGCADIVGFGHNGVWVAKNRGDGMNFESPKLVLEEFGVAQGWQGETNPRFVVDITGDGCADIVGFGKDGVYVSYSNGDGTFGQPEKLTPNDEFSENSGWDADHTVRQVVNLFQ